MVLAGEADIGQFLDPDQCTQMKDTEGTDCVSVASVETLLSDSIRPARS